MFISRQRLASSILESPHSTVVQAGASCGKSVLLRQLVDADPRVFVVPGPISDAQNGDADFRASIARSTTSLDIGLNTQDPIDLLLIELRGAGFVPAFDDLDRWAPSVVSAVQLASKTTTRQPMIASSRRSLDSLQRPHWQRIATMEMAFTQDEVIALLSDLTTHEATTSAAALIEMTNGWPGPTARAADSINRSTNPVAELTLLSQSANVLNSEIHSILAELGPDDRGSVAALSALASFDDPTIEIVGGIGFGDRIRAAGVPLVPESGGWQQLLPQFRRSLERQQGGTRSTSDRILRHLLTAGRPMNAIHACLGVGEHERAARLIAAMSLDDELALPPGALNAAIGAIGDSVESAPRCLSVQAHVNAINGDSATGERAIERAIEIHNVQDPELESDDHLEALVILGTFHAYARRTAEAGDVVERCRPRIDVNRAIPLTAQFHELAASHAMGLTAVGLEIAYDHCHRALAIWHQLGHRRQAIATTFRLAGSVMVQMGRHAEAVELLDALPSIGSLSPLLKARWHIERAAALPYIGRAEEVRETLADARRIIESLDQGWMLKFANITELIAATFLDDDVRIVRLANDVLDERETYHTRAQDAIHHCYAAAALSRSGHTELARRFHAIAAATREMDDWIGRLFGAYVTARSDDPKTALSEFEILSLDDNIMQSDRWQIAFHRALAYLRLNERETALKHLEESRREAKAIGAPEILEIVEWRALPLFEDADEALDLKTSELVMSRLMLFGPFGIGSGDHRVDLASGLGSTLLKNLALNDGRLVTDQVVELLWPGDEPRIGRTRLRNVLTRLREACGQIVERDGDALKLASFVDSDWAEMQRVADDALKRRAIDALDAAITLADRPLLPDDRYDDWAEQARNDHRRLHLRLLDNLADAQEAAGDNSAAAGTLRRAEALELVPGRRQDRIERLTTSGHPET